MRAAGGTRLYTSQQLHMLTHTLALEQPPDVARASAAVAIGWQCLNRQQQTSYLTNVNNMEGSVLNNLVSDFFISACQVIGPVADKEHALFAEFHSLQIAVDNVSNKLNIEAF